MIYTAQSRNDYDFSFRYKKQSFLCYSGRKMKELYPDKSYQIIGFARDASKETDYRLAIGEKQMPVYSIDEKSMMYKSIGFLPVDEDADQFIAIQESRKPFIIAIGTMTTLTAGLCGILLLNTPSILNANPVDPE